MIRTIERCACCRGINADGLEVDLQRRELRYADRTIHVQPAEAAILYRLVEARGGAVSYERIMTALWGVDADAHPDSAQNVIRTRTNYVRKKLAELGAPYTIGVVWGIGLRLQAVEQQRRRA